jgi:amino acid transporter
LSRLSVTIEVLGVTVLMGALWLIPPRQPVGFLLKTFSASPIHAPYLWLFILGLLHAEWIFTGYDASAHIAEETVDARRRAPWGLVSSVMISGVVGYALILSVTWVIPNIAAILNAQDRGNHPLPAILAIVETTLGNRTGTAVLWLIILSMWFCGLACVTSLSRTIYAFARDNGLPLSRLWSLISSEHHTPAAAVWLSVVLSFVILLYSDAMSVVASLCVLGFYLSYFIPIFLGWRLKKQWIGQRGPWHLGLASNLINVLALVWIVCVCFITVMPPNALAGYAIVGVIVVLYALHRFTGPHQVRKHEWGLVGQETNAASKES